MNEVERLAWIVLNALACPLVLPILLSEKEADHEVSE